MSQDLLHDASIGAINEAFLVTGSEAGAIQYLMKRRTMPHTQEDERPDCEECEGKTHRIFRMSERKRYKAAVWKLTELQPLHLLPNIEKRAFRGWHIDHVLSIMEGYRRGLPAETIAHISNLRMLPAKENLNKGIRTIFTNLLNE